MITVRVGLDMAWGSEGESHSISNRNAPASFIMKHQVVHVSTSRTVDEELGDTMHGTGTPPKEIEDDWPGNDGTEKYIGVFCI